MTAAPKAVAEPVKKRSLDDITSSGIQEVPLRMVVYGIQGIGKSTLAAQAQNPYFMDIEGGSNQLPVRGRARPKSYPELLEFLQILLEDTREYKTLVIDAVDAIEPMIWDFCVARDKKKFKTPVNNIEDYGFGKGFLVAMEEWRKLVKMFDKFVDRGLSVILIGHSQVKAFKPPEGEPYDKYELKLHKFASGYLKEWSDMLLFANYEIHAVKSDARSKAQGVSTGARLLYTSASAVYDAKNRFALPEVLNLSFDDLKMALKGRDPKELVAEIKRKATLIDAGEEVKCLAALDRAGDDITKLMQLNSWVNSRPQTRAVLSTEE